MPGTLATALGANVCSCPWVPQNVSAVASIRWRKLGTPYREARGGETRGDQDQARRTPSLRPITSAKESGEAGDERSTDTGVCAQHRPSVLDDRINPIAGLAL